ncbi:hypothetical protein HHI36_021873 [Cryptolaemus montrouzieri]|uniref:Myeloid differentiation primary response protein MyD88 n=1 Tax=Cryptolaemus montrouzieri TaxID=559131 RepID=A0ABD2MYF3_9CUCU
MEAQNNMEDPLQSSLSIRILRNKSTKLLSAMLNPPKVIHTSEGLPRNWKGLAELCSIESYLISNLEFNSDPTKEVLRLWQMKGEVASIKQLIGNLETLDRFDVIDDIRTLLVGDIEFHNQHPNGFLNQAPLDQDLDKYCLTVDDVANIDQNVQFVQYDAFVLFADDDIDFATEVVETMEKQYYLKFCVKDRDLVGGIFEHEAIIKLISKRCQKLIVILSPSFFASPLHTFFLNFTRAISLETRKIVPCLYKPCPNMPPEVTVYHMLDYTKPRPFWNFWDKLYESIKMKKAPPNASNRIALTLARREQQPRQPIFKTNSHRDTDSRLRTSNHTVKFNSLIDLSNPDVEQIMPDASLIPSTSANSLGTNYSEPEKKIKQKKSWYRILLPKYFKMYQNEHIKTNGEVGNNREKKKFWNIHKKRKAEVAT